MYTAWFCHRRRFCTNAVFLLALLSSTPVFAHTGDTSGGFTSGLSHPIGGLDHVLAMVAVGVWQAGRALLRTAGAGVLVGGLFFLCRSIGWLS
jgi:hydrogenase/urease accessory protein HupE